MVNVLSPSVVALDRSVAQLPFPIILNLRRDGTRVEGFDLATPRTRGLTFQRM